MRNILWQSDAWNEYEALQAEKATLKRTNKLLKDIMRNGYQCSYGKVEMLKGDFSGYASVRMNLHPHAVRSASRSPDPMEMVSLAAVSLTSFKPPFERRLAVRTRAVHKPSIRWLFAFGIPVRGFIPQPGSGSIPDM